MKYIFRLALCFIAFSVNAGVEITCPDLTKGEDTRDWLVVGKIHKNEFKSVLISLTRVMGANTVTCKYQNSLSLVQNGNFQIGSDNGFWQTVNVGGLSFKQCLATISMCKFYSG